MRGRVCDAMGKDETLGFLAPKYPKWHHLFARGKIKMLPGLGTPMGHTHAWARYTIHNWFQTQKFFTCKNLGLITFFFKYNTKFKSHTQVGPYKFNFTSK